MKVNPNQNSGIPTPAQESEAIKDGTSNTMSAKSSKTEKPFSKDSFESSRSEMGAFPTLDGSSKDAAFRGNAPRDVASELKSGASEVLMEKFSARGEANIMKVQED